MKRRSISFGIYWNEDDIWLINRIDKLCLLERVSRSELIARACEEYVERHGEGNPQKPLFPSKEPWTNPPVEKRRENLQWIIDLIKANPGMDQLKFAARFSEESGLRLETINEYIHTLLMSKAIYRRAGGLYVTERMQPGTEKEETSAEVSRSASWQDCQKPVTPDCQHCLSRFDCKRFEKEAPK